MHTAGWTHGGISNKEHKSGGWLKGSDCAIALVHLLITVKSVFQALWPFQNITVWQQTCNYTIIVHYHHTEHLSSLTKKTTSGCAPWSGLTTWPVLSSASVPFLLLNPNSTPTQHIPGGVFPGTEMLIHIMVVQHIPQMCDWVTSIHKPAPTVADHCILGRRQSVLLTTAASGHHVLSDWCVTSLDKDADRSVLRTLDVTSASSLWAFHEADNNINH